MAQGALQATGNPLDLAIEGEGFFQIQTANGLRYTRDGGFHRARSGQLVTAAGEPVLSTAGQPIHDSAGRGYVSARTGASRWPAARWRRWASSPFPPAPNSLPRAPTATSRRPGRAAAASANATVHQGALESANQDVMQGSLDLIVMQRQAEMMQRALTVFHTEFNKIATEDLPRI